jgi:hypothetical protein
MQLIKNPKVKLDLGLSEQASALAVTPEAPSPSLKRLSLTPEVGTTSPPGGKSQLLFGPIFEPERNKRSGGFMGFGLGNSSEGLFSKNNDFVISKLGNTSLNRQNGLSRSQLQNIQQQEMSLINIPAQKITPKNKIFPESPIKVQEPFIPGFGLGGIETGGGQKGKVGETGLFGGTRYSASLGSILLGKKVVRVTKAEAERLSKETFSGLELRPEIQVVENTPKKKSLFW